MFEDPIVFLAFVFGAIWGSFANVVIVRLPLGESVVFPGSHCRSTGQPIAWYDNIPIISWILLRGRSRSDGSSISPRYPFVELIVGLLFACSYVVFGWSVSTLEAMLFSFGLVVVTFIDFDHFILPDVFTLPGVVLGLLGATLNPDRSFFEALVGVLVGGGFLYFIAWSYEKLKNEEGMGGGDIKLLAWAGAVLGWKSIPFIILSSSFLGLFGGVFYALKTGKGMKTVLPFGPFIALAALIYLFSYWPSEAGEPIPLPFFDFGGPID